MTEPRTIDTRGLDPAATQLVEAYFARVHGSLLVAATGECAETVEDLREHVYERLADTAGTSDDVRRVLAELGPPESLAAQCAEQESDADDVLTSGAGESPFAGTLLGLPYDLRLPSSDRVAVRWWDPLNPRIFVPRLFGIGWTINFGALAVKLRLVEPDDEDVPFAAVPKPYLYVALALPVIIAALFGALVVIYQPILPAQVAVHWGFDGTADRFDSKETALILPLLMTTIGLVSVGGAWAGRRPALNRVAAGGLATLLTTISAAVYAQQVATAYGARGSAIVIAGVVASLALPFALLVTLSRIGHAAEVRRDLNKKGERS